MDSAGSPAIRGTRAPRSVTAGELQNAGILIVDDQPSNLVRLYDLLTGAGYRRLVCEHDPGKAAERCAALRPELVLLDLEMPTVDGFAVLGQLRELEPGGGPTVLILSGTEDAEARFRALDMGARDFIGKPFDLPSLLARIRCAFEARGLTRRVSEEHRALEQSVMERTREMREAELEVVHRLAAAAERRDPSVGPHLVRMSRICSCVAEAYGWPPEATNLMLHASPLHDVGKIGIPDAILLKPGSLDPQEWEVMKSHTTIGGDLLGRGSSRLIQTGQSIALSHHERWDGSGYPRGLAGEAIPLAARICAVCDVFDAMTSDRVYQRASRVEDAVEFIAASRGTWFDPAIVTAFTRVLPEILEVRAEASAPGVSALG